MKTITIWILILSTPFLFIACSIDPSTEVSELTSFENEHTLGSNLFSIENQENEFDVIGKVQNSIFENYFSESRNYSSIEEIYNAVHQHLNNSAHTELNSTLPIPNLIAKVAAIRDEPELSLNTIIAGSHLSTVAKQSLSHFIGSLLLLQEGDYTKAYNFMVSYETSVIESTLFNNEDKRVILTTTALIRYSSIEKKRRKDKDWETSVGNIAITVEGALHDSRTAIQMALVATISTNVILSH